ncbi:hypothetical protein [uncultured Cardiobacterium sp.]|uniref:hypothetical protein n=1 Tax=uncultured Cardiobacterium sp. TaxID=417619 RepID=UPI002625DAE1|nr:hypothetical protein [uncultured Cardiobacterium sp.]
MRFLFPLLAVLAAPFAAALGEADLLGRWSCSTSYPEINAKIDDVRIFNADGTTTSDGTTIFFIRDGLLQYTTHNEETWTLKDGVLRVETVKSTVERAMPPRIQKMLDEKPDVAAFEAKMFGVLRGVKAGDAVSLTVDKADKQQLNMHDERDNPTECTRAGAKPAAKQKKGK